MDLWTYFTLYIKINTNMAILPQSMWSIMWWYVERDQRAKWDMCNLTPIKTKRLFVISTKLVDYGKSPIKWYDFLYGYLQSQIISL